MLTIRCLVVEEHQSKILLGRTSSGTWGLPGGAVEHQESPLQCAYRELQEETALTPGILCCRGFWEQAGGVAVGVMAILCLESALQQLDHSADPEFSELQLFSVQTLPGEIFEDAASWIRSWADTQWPSVKLLHLQYELLRSVMSHADAPSLARAATSCVELREAVREEDMWRGVVKREWGWLVPCNGRCEGTWRELAHQLHTRRAHFVVVAGGAPQGHTLSFDIETGGSGATDKVQTLVVGAEEWVPCPRLLEERCCASVAVCATGDLFVLGGGESMYANARALQTVERLTVLDGQWEPSVPMNKPRCGAGAAIALQTGLLFAAGGYAGSGQYLDCAEYLDLTNAESWRMLPKMSCARAGANAVVGPDGRLLVLGGGPDGNHAYSSIEALDLRMSHWDNTLPECHVARHYNAAAFGPDGMLYVAGAYRHTGQLDVVERYDPRANRWEFLPGMGSAKELNSVFQCPINFSAGVFVFS